MLVEAIGKEFKIPNNQVLALFDKAMQKIHLHFTGLLEEQIKDEESNDPTSRQVLDLPEELPDKTLMEEIEENASNVKRSLDQKKDELVKQWGLNKLKQYSIEEFDEEDFTKVLNGKVPSKTMDDSAV